MGAWGHENFDSDQAMDFVDEFLANPSAAGIVEALTVVEDLAEEDEYIEVDEASAALAAAELVAFASGNPGPELPKGVAEALAPLDVGADRHIRKLARRVVKHVVKSSELQELWAENGEPNEWQQAQQNLLMRLK